MPWLSKSASDRYIRKHPRRPSTLRPSKVTVFTLYAMATRSVVATVGQPLQDARARRAGLFKAAASEKKALQAAAAAATVASAAADAASSVFDDVGGGGGGGVVGAAADALAREALEPMPFAYLPSVGALLLLAAAVAAHTLLLLGKKWCVRFHAW